MFKFLRKRNENFEIQGIEKHSFTLILLNLIQCLNKAGHNGQAKFIENLLQLIKEDDLDQFVKLINGVNMWGGAGAVWEVYIEDEADEIKFAREMIALINLMERAQILGKGIKSIRKFFRTIVN